MSVNKSFFILFLVVLSSAHVWGQAARSPFTSAGIGEHYGNQLTNHQAMGGTGVSDPQVIYLNNTNPALLVYNRFTIFEAGMLVESRGLRSSTVKERHAAGNMSYLTTAFPVMYNKWVTSVGLMPYTNVDYRFGKSRTVPGDPDQTEFFAVEEGSGGLTQFYWSNGVRLHKYFTIGAKATYLFGSTENNFSPQLPNATTFTTVSEKSSLNDFNFSLGLSFSKDSLGYKNKYRISVGAVYELQNDISTKLGTRTFTTTSAGDTISSATISKRRGNTSIPSSLILGVSLRRDLDWAISAEMAMQDYTQFSSDNPDKVRHRTKAWRASIGGEFIPDPMSVDNYFKRITFRLGASIEQYPFLFNDHELRDIGVTGGFSLPAGKSSLNIAAKFGKRGNVTDNILAENYIKLFFGITFNDQWFIKRKFD
jgi:hypothetical protein